MCGIVGVVGNVNAVEITLEGLKKLEYRGYDSAGICALKNDNFKIVKERGKIVNLEEALEKAQLYSDIAIGHTRWATHGIPSQINAHPHNSPRFCVVHNGIIENYQEIQKKLDKKKSNFLSETDTEVIPHLIEYHYDKENDIKKSLIKACQDLHGTFAIALLFKEQQDVIAVAKKGSPLVIGVGKGENYISSDYYALSQYSDKIVTLEDGDFALIYKDKIIIFDENCQEVKRSFRTIHSNKAKISKEGFDHFMLKEIFEQPRVIEETVQTYINLSDNSIHLANFNFDLRNFEKITIVACGTSYYAGMSAKYILEELARIQVEVEIASEFRYRNNVFSDKNLMIFISQSGETADSLAALKYAKANKQKILSIVNVPFSSMAQLSDCVIRTVAGPEIGVASTKAYSAQISILSLFAIHLADIKGKLSNQQKINLIKQLLECGIKMQELLKVGSVKSIKQIAKSLAKSKNALYIGRGISYVSALESALKLREISYINAHGIAAGELKHGTIALIDKKMPVIVIAPYNEAHDLFEKTLSNAAEVNARGGKLIALSDKTGLKRFAKYTKKFITTTEINGLIEEALLPVVSMQLLAYYTALHRGSDIDQPRNLAKSVTVE